MEFWGCAETSPIWVEMCCTDDASSSYGYQKYLREISPILYCLGRCFTKLQIKFGRQSCDGIFETQPEIVATPRILESGTEIFVDSFLLRQILIKSQKLYRSKLKKLPDRTNWTEFMHYCINVHDLDRISRSISELYRETMSRFFMEKADLSAYLRQNLFLSIPYVDAS